MKNWFILLFSILIIVTTALTSKGQEKPPRPIGVTVKNAQGIVFGSFVHGISGGTIYVSPSGSATPSGSIILISSGSAVISPAIFLVEGIKGTLITISMPASTTLTGSNGGILTLNLGDPNSLLITSCGSPFVLTAESPSTMDVRIGGTLTVGSTGSNPPGSYSGSFDVTFIQN